VKQRTSRIPVVFSLAILTIGALVTWGFGVVRWIARAGASQVIVIPARDRVPNVPIGLANRAKIPTAMSTEDQLALARMIDSDDANGRQAAIDQIRLLADSKPAALAIGLPDWVSPLMRVKQYSALAEITLPAILARTFDPATVQAAQRARVLAFLNEHDYSQALKEAKSYYNICSLSATAEAVDLIVQVLQTSDESAVAVKFKADQMAAGSPSSVLMSTTTDSAPYRSAIAGLQKRSNSKKGGSHNNLMALGNLMLLTDRPVEAKACFEAAAKAESNANQNLRLAMEGVAKAIRDQDGSVYAANAFITSIRQNPSKAGIDLVKAGFTSWEELRISAQAIALSKLPTEVVPALEQERLKEERVAVGASKPPTIVSGFEGSTPVYVAALSPNHLVVEITTNGFRDWFMFQIQGVANRTIRIDVTGAYKTVPDWPQKAWSINPVYAYASSLDDPALFQTSSALEHIRASNGTVMPVALGHSWNYIPDTWNDDYTLSCVMHFDADSAFVAMRVPRTATFNEQFLSRMKSNDQCEVFQIGHSAKGRPLLVTEIGTPSLEKPCALIYAGEHADEQDAGWVAQGAIEYLLGDDPKAVELRHRYTFLVIPLLDPDAAVAGIHESIISSFLPDRATMESIAYANWFENWAKSGNRLDVAIDLHNIQSGEGPHVFCPLLEAGNPRGSLSLALHKLIVNDIQRADYGVQLNPQTRGWMPDRLCGWLSHNFGTLSIAYEVNSQAPERHLSLAEIKALGGIFVQSLDKFFGGTDRQSLLAEVDARRKQRAERWAISTLPEPESNAIIAEADVFKGASGMSEVESAEKSMP